MDPDELEFDDAEYAVKILKEYKNVNGKDSTVGEDLVKSAKHILAGRLDTLDLFLAEMQFRLSEIRVNTNPMKSKVPVRNGGSIGKSTGKCVEQRMLTSRIMPVK